MAKTHPATKPKSSKWGNKWTIEKLEAFKKYVDAYLTIMEAHKNKYCWRTLYFDGFAGSGDQSRGGGNSSKETDCSLLLDLGIEEAEAKIYKGAAERVLSLKKTFDYYYFIDLEEESLGRLQEKLK